MDSASLRRGGGQRAVPARRRLSVAVIGSLRLPARSGSAEMPGIARAAPDSTVNIVCNLNSITSSIGPISIAPPVMSPAIAASRRTRRPTSRARLGSNRKPLSWRAFSRSTGWCRRSLPPPPPRRFRTFPGVIRSAPRSSPTPSWSRPPRSHSSTRSSWRSAWRGAISCASVGAANAAA